MGTRAYADYLWVVERRVTALAPQPSRKGFVGVPKSAFYCVAIKRAEPADHARLEVHFAVLAEQYEADAKRHNAIAQAFISSPLRRRNDGHWPMEAAARGSGPGFGSVVSVMRRSGTTSASSAGRHSLHRGTRVLMNNEPTTIQQPPSTNQLVI